MSPEEVQLIVEEADPNGDGRLDYSELSGVIVRQAQLCVERLQERAQEKEERRRTEQKPATDSSHTSKMISDSTPFQTSPHSVPSMSSSDSIPEVLSVTPLTSVSVPQISAGDEVYTCTCMYSTVHVPTVQYTSYIHVHV